MADASLIKNGTGHEPGPGTAEVEPTDPRDAVSAIDIDPAKMPVRMLPISADELEHTEDKNLDAEFESHLLREGDDLLPIKDGEATLGQFAAGSEDDGASGTFTESKQKGENRAVDIALDLSLQESDSTVEMPVLPDDPTEEDLIEFASKHPAVRHITGLFRGKVRAVRKK